eukprot:TRINITY_DN3600_c0_g1_i11.p1 TRINITY_DN3600_c0_g1~~TRINITY_DN3600_c0_g1_i11.p1  ORF type:complete len:177 (+),score=22.59 TRINITY_DN3600_c0_g1_i11:28-558(+)
MKITPTDILRVGFTTLVILFFILAVVYLPINLASIKISLEPGLTAFFGMILGLFIVKAACAIHWCFIIFSGNSLSFVNAALQILGSIVVGIFTLVTCLDIYSVLKDISFLFAIQIIVKHPFVIEFSMFMVCNIVSYFVMRSNSNSQTNAKYVKLSLRPTPSVQYSEDEELPHWRSG